ncbi:MAG: IMPACT family protein [Dysgonomonas sp.]
MNDTFKTIKDTAKGLLTEKKSKFIAFAVPVESIEEIKLKIEEYRKEYYDARHICWAYMLGHDRKDFRANDDGEPSGTAGKPILGQINSNELTNVLVLVIRYFGGIKLGTSGLISAYKGAAYEAIANAEIIEKTVDADITFKFEYLFLNDVMKIIKDLEPQILKQQFDMDCIMSLRIRQSEFQQLKDRLEKIESLSVFDNN